MRWRFEVMKKARTLPRTRRYGGNYETAGLDASTKDTEHNMVVEDNMDNELIASQDEGNSNADDDTSDTSMEAQLSQEPSNSSSMHFVLEATESNNNNSNS